MDIDASARLPARLRCRSRRRHRRSWTRGARIAPLGVLLFTQLVLLCAFLGICVAAGPDASPAAPMLIVAAMLGVAATGGITGISEAAIVVLAQDDRVEFIEPDMVATAS